MFSIAICDDEAFICSELEKLIQLCCKENSYKVTLDSFYSGEELWSAIEGGESFNLIFLDIALKQLSGIDVGKKIRDKQTDETTQIVYISSTQEYAMKLFRVRPFDFLVKPLSAENVNAVLTNYFKTLPSYHDTFSFQEAGSIRRVPWAQILYFEKQGRKIRVVCQEEDYFFAGKLSSVAEQAEPYAFLTIHQSFLIHRIYVKGYEYDKVTMANGDVLSISQPHRTQVRAILFAQLRDEQK